MSKFFSFSPKMYLGILGQYIVVLLQYACHILQYIAISFGISNSPNRYDSQSVICCYCQFIWRFAWCWTDQFLNPSFQSQKCYPLPQDNEKETYNNFPVINRQWLHICPDATFGKIHLPNDNLKYNGRSK